MFFTTPLPPLTKSLTAFSIGDSEGVKGVGMVVGMYSNAAVVNEMLSK